VSGPESVLAGQIFELPSRVVDGPDLRVLCEPSYETFRDGSDNIHIPGLVPGNNVFVDSDVFLFCTFGDNDVTMKALHVAIVLLESFIHSLTIVIPFMKCATMERVITEGTVATASTTARLLSNLPSCGRPVRVVTYDLHTLQNRFYLSGNALASLHSLVPAALPFVWESVGGKSGCRAVFPDAGALKRFGAVVDTGQEPVFCSKQREGDRRIVEVHDNGVSVQGQHCLVVDDLLRTGGTLIECARALKNRGATSVSALCLHVADCEGLAKVAASRVFTNVFVTDTVPKEVDRFVGRLTRMAGRTNVMQLDIASIVAGHCGIAAGPRRHHWSSLW
jgi:phosphoribosylpyrophosphate synthetase